MNKRNEISTEIFQKHKCCIIIPTYNNQNTLRLVIENCLVYCNDVWIINDGSTDNTKEILNEIKEVKILHQEVNRGKGAALRRTFKEAMDAGFEYAITIDSDGQHEPADLLSFAKVLDEDPGVIYIGARNMDQYAIPGKSKFGHINSNFWFWIETGIKAEDTQSGYRLYPLKVINKLSLFTWRYEFEIEVIVRAAWKGMDVKFIPIKVYYPKDRVSHFRPFKDFSRVALLNLWLVFAALHWYRPVMMIRQLRKKKLRQILRDHLIKPDEPALRKSMAMGLGIFCGIIPIWGFQTITAIGLSFIFKLNKPITLLGSNISFPPLIPFVIYGSIATGGLLLDGKLPGPIPDFSDKLILNDLSRYVVGAVVLAIFIGSLGAFITWITVKLLFRKKQKADVGIK